MGALNTRKRVQPGNHMPENRTSGSVEGCYPAIEYLRECHSCEGRNPGGYWMPDQVRHDGVGVYCCRVNNIPTAR